MTDEHIDEVLALYSDRKTVEKESYLASFEDIEKNDFNLNIPRYVDNFEKEEEIDLKELFLVLWRYKVKILIIAFICMVLGFAAGKITGAKSKKSTVVVEYTYPGIEEGKSPSGNTLGLTYNQFKNIFMIKDVFHKMPELENNGLTEDGVLNGIKITPVLPEGLKEGEVYYPNKFTYS